MWFRFFSISVLHWIAATAAAFLMVRFVFPQGLLGIALEIPMWILMFGLALGFAMWAFDKKLPGKRETAWLLGIWFITTFIIQAAFEINLYGRPAFLLYSTDLHLQYFLEILGILFAAYLTRRRKIHAVLGVGMSE